MDQNIIKSYTTASGKNVVYRYPVKEDLDGMLNFANKLITEDTFILLSGKPLTRKEEEKVLNESILHNQNGTQIRISVIIDGIYSGGGDIRPFSKRKSHVAELGVSLLKEYRGEGIGTDLLKTLIAIAKQKGFKLLTLTCFENNSQALHIYQKLGFIKVGITPKAIFYKNEYIGEVLFYLPL